MSVCEREQQERDRMLAEATAERDADLLADLLAELAQARLDLALMRADRDELLAVAADAVAAAGANL